MKAEATHCVLHYVWLNAHARRYADASNPVEKREALRDYLSELRILAALADRDNLTSHVDFRPLYELSECLHQIDNKELPKLLTPPPRKSGAPPTVRGAQHQWARASALITVLMKKFNKDEDEAARIAARALEKFGRPAPGRGRNAAKSLKDWRDKLMAGEKSEQARTWYDNAVAAANHPILWKDVTESAAIQILLDPSQFDYDHKYTY